MPLIPIPFTKGQSEAVDSKLLPNGLFTSLVNCRYRKDGRLGVRFGYDFDANGSVNPGPTNAYAAITVADKENLIFGARQTTVPPTVNRHTAFSTTPYELFGTTSASTGADLGVPEIVQNIKQYFSAGNFAPAELLTPFAIGSVDLTASASAGRVNLLATAYQMGTSTVVGGSGTGMTPPQITGAATMVTAQLDNAASNAKVIAIGGQDCLFWANSANQIRMVVLPGAIVTVVTASAGRAPYFDISPGGSATEAYLVYQSAANTLSFGTVNNLGVFTLLNTIATTNTEARAAISPTFNAPTDQLAIVWNDGATFVTGEARYTVYRRSTTSFIIATTTVSASGNTVTNYPTVGPHPTGDWVATFITKGSTVGTSTPCELGWFFSGATVGVYRTFSDIANVTKPFIVGTGCYVIAVDRDLFNAADAASYVIIDLQVGFFGARVEMGFAYNIARPSDTVSILSDPRRQVVTGVVVAGVDPGLTACMFALPTKTSLANGINLYRMESGLREEQLSSALLNNQVVLSGSRILEYDRQTVVGSGFLTTPSILSVSGAGAFSYQYVMVFEYFDKLGFRHISIPSLPFTVTGTAPPLAQVAYLSPFVDFEKESLTGVTARLYRTTASGTIFYFVQAQVITPAIPSTVLVFANDTLADSAISVNEVLYTQGARGGLSGILQNDAPPPARYITAGSDRLLLGGMETPTQVQWSKLRFDGEPLNFSNTAGFRANVDGRVTGVAEMDGTWYVFTRDTIWTVTGEGPDDSGAGTFSAPQRLPSDTGCLSHRSIVKSGLGLIFQGITGRFFLLPRGGGACQEIGQVVRDTMLAFPYVSASTYNQEEQVAYWAVTDTTASAGRIIVYDTIRNLWSVDNFYARAIKALSIFDGKLVIDGSIVETAAYTDDDTGAKTDAIIPQWVTGDIRAFGQNGWGRYRRVQLLGEARDVTVSWSATLDVSYDSGKTFAETATWTRANLALAIGDAIDGAEHAFVTQKTDTIRLRGSWSTPTPTEGFVWNGLSLDVRPEGGLKRIANAGKAA